MEDQELYKVKRQSYGKIEDDSLYKKNYKEAAKDIPVDELRMLLTLFFNKAAVNMGKESYDAPDAAIDSIMEFIYRDYGILPIENIASGIIRGSLGKYGPGRLVPATVYKWLHETIMEYEKLVRHQELGKIEYTQRLDVVKYPVGKALIKKIVWLKNGVIDSDDWDILPLKEMAERIAQGLDVVPELWGIKSKKQTV